MACPRKSSTSCAEKFTSIGSYIFEEIYDQTGDAETHCISTLLLKYLTVATIYMLSDVLHMVAKLQGSLQSEKLDLASVPTMVTNTINRLKELKEKPDTSTWFKNHASVFSDHQGQLGHKNIKITEEEKTEFLCSTYLHIYRVLLTTQLVEWGQLI